jgi:hypothetical protein
MTAAFHRFVTERFEAYRDRPEMWGSNDALELSALTLMESEVQHYCPEALENNPRIVIEAYIEEIGRRFHLTTVPLQQHVRNPKEFAKILFDICQKIRYEIGSALSIWGVGGKATYLFPEPIAVTGEKEPDMPEMGAAEKAEFIARINTR